VRRARMNSDAARRRREREQQATDDPALAVRQLADRVRYGEIHPDAPWFMARMGDPVARQLVGYGGDDGASPETYDDVPDEVLRWVHELVDGQDARGVNLANEIGGLYRGMYRNTPLRRELAVAVARGLDVYRDDHGLRPLGPLLSYRRRLTPGEERSAAGWELHARLGHTVRERRGQTALVERGATSFMLMRELSDYLEAGVRAWLSQPHAQPNPVRMNGDADRRRRERELAGDPENLQAIERLFYEVLRSGDWFRATEIMNVMADLMWTGPMTILGRGYEHLPEGEYRRLQDAHATEWEARVARAEAAQAAWGRMSGAYNSATEDMPQEQVRGLHEPRANGPRLAEADPQELAAAVRKHPSVIKRLAGVTPGKLLGCGVSGCVFLVKDGPGVLKVSVRDDEARLAAALAGPRSRPFLPVFHGGWSLDPKKLPGLPREVTVPIGVLHREDLRDLPYPADASAYPDAVMDLVGGDKDERAVIANYGEDLSEVEIGALLAISGVLAWGPRHGLRFDPLEFSWEEDDDVQLGETRLLPNALANLGVSQDGSVVIRDLGGFEEARPDSILSRPPR